MLKGEVAYRVRELIHQTCLGLDMRIEKKHVGKGHACILALSPPTLSPSELMTRVKGRPPKSKLQQEFAHLRKRYWRRYFWHGNIFAWADPAG